MFHFSQTHLDALHPSQEGVAPPNSVSRMAPPDPSRTELWVCLITSVDRSPGAVRSLEGETGLHGNQRLRALRPGEPEGLRPGEPEGPTLPLSLLISFNQPQLLRTSSAYRMGS